MRIISNFVVGKIQEMWHLFLGPNVTRQLDASPLTMRSTPRCGRPSVHQFGTMMGKPVWTKHHATYGIKNYPPWCGRTLTMPSPGFSSTEWCDPLQFKQKNSEEADIIIYFPQGAHRDSNSDGRDGNITCAYGPGAGIGGGLYFDRAEIWI